MGIVSLRQTNFFALTCFWFFRFKLRVHHYKLQLIIFQGLLATKIIIKANSFCDFKNRFLS